MLDWAHPEGEDPLRARGSGKRPMIPDSLRENPVITALGDLAAGAKLEFGELTVMVSPGGILEALRKIKREMKFEQLTTVTAVDRYPAEPRFEIVYHLHSFANKERLRVKALVSGENPEIESACGVLSRGQLV